VVYNVFPADTLRHDMISTYDLLTLSIHCVMCVSAILCPNSVTNFIEIEQYRPTKIDNLNDARYRVCCYWHVILHPPAKFRSNRTMDGGVLTSYRIFKMAAIESEIYFGIGV